MTWVAQDYLVFASTLVRKGYGSEKKNGKAPFLLRTNFSPLLFGTLWKSYFICRRFVIITAQLFGVGIPAISPCHQVPYLGNQDSERIYPQEVRARWRTAKAGKTRKYVDCLIIKKNKLWTSSVRMTYWRYPNHRKEVSSKAFGAAHPIDEQPQ